jgi:hypothetical protein
MRMRLKDDLCIIPMGRLPLATVAGGHCSVQMPSHKAQGKFAVPHHTSPSRTNLHPN